MLRAAIVGFGGIATSHRRAYAELEKEGKIKLVAAYDVDPAAFTKRVTINIGTSTDFKENINRYTSLDEMFEKEEIDLVDICAPTYVHRELTVDILRRGYHVMCEKPMSLNYADCLQMIEAAKESGKQLMIGQCVRFYPAYDYVKEVIETGKFGKFLGAAFRRLSIPPTWGYENWFMCPERSGGCLTDLHIHDVDLVRHLFGEPKAVSCSASTSVCIHDTVHSSFYYDGAPITAIGDWSLNGITFSADSQINFEKATIRVSMDELTVYPKDGTESYSVPTKMEHNAQFIELSYFHDVIEGVIENKKNPPESAALTILLAEHLRKSANSNGERVEFKIV